MDRDGYSAIQVARALLVAAFFATTGSAADLPQPVKVVAYNLMNYLPMSRTVGGHRAAGAPKPEGEKAAVTKILCDLRPDIVGLSEIGDEAQVADLQGRLKAAGLDLPHSAWLGGLDSERHLAVLSRFPILENHSQGEVRFEINGQSEGIQRGIVNVVIGIGDRYRLRLVGVHLKSRRNVPQFDQAQLRAKEAYMLRNYLDGILKEAPETNLLLFGDLNDTKNEYPIRQIIGPKGKPGSLQDLSLADTSGDRWTHYWATADEYSRIDYLMVNRGLRPEIMQEKSGIYRSPYWNEGSDHRPIFTAIVPQDR